MLRHLPNAITLLRMLLVLPLCWLIAGERYQAALVVAAAAGASDALDGFLAKRCGWRSWLGGMLDPLADKLLLTAGFLGLAWMGRIPGWLAGLVVLRDVVIVAGAAAYHRLVGRFTASPSRLSKLTTVVQIVYVLVVLLAAAGWIGLDRGLHLALALVTAFVTLASGAQYVLVWTSRARRHWAAAGRRR